MRFFCCAVVGGVCVLCLPSGVLRMTPCRYGVTLYWQFSLFNVGVYAEDGLLLVASGADGGVCRRAVHPMLVPPASPTLAPTLAAQSLRFSNTYGGATIQRLQVGSSLGNALTVDLGTGSRRGVAIAVACMLDALPPAGSEATLAALHSSVVLPDQAAIRLAVQSDGTLRFGISVTTGGAWDTFQVATSTALSAGVWAVVVGNFVGATRQMSVWVDGSDATVTGEGGTVASQVR